jgi:hypothetical protein
MLQGAQPLTRAQVAIATAGAFVAALARFVPLSKGPWDWDEVLFCLAVRAYNVAWHYPHPPGFPLYIGLGKVARLFTGSDFHALQAVNVAAAIAVFPVMFWLARTLRLPFLSSFLAAFLFAFLPNVWFFGGTAFSDVPAMVMFLAAIAAYLGAGTSMRRYLIASMLFGAALLIRPQNALVVVFPWTLATIRFVRLREWRTVVAGSSLVAAIVVLGYGIAAWQTGFTDYYYALLGHSSYVTRADTVASPLRPSLLTVFLWQIDPYHAGKVSILVNVLALIGLVVGRRRAVAETLLTFAPFFFFAMFVVNPLGSSRFALNYMAGIILLATIGIEALSRVVPRAQTAISIALVAVIAGRFIIWVLPAFETPRTTDAPPVQAAKFVAEHAPKTSTVFMDESIWPWATYFIRDHERVHVFSYAEAVRHPGVSDGWFLQMNASQLTGARVFRRPRNRTWNVVTPRAFEATVMPAASLAAFDKGWHDLEGSAEDPWRWSKRVATMQFPPLRHAGNCELRLKFAAPVAELKKPIGVTFLWNGQRVGTFVTDKPENTVYLHVRSRDTRPNDLVIQVSETLNPRKLGLSHDWRDLGIMFRNWQWRRM